jgi:hypothetical protein
LYAVRVTMEFVGLDWLIEFAGLGGLPNPTNPLDPTNLTNWVPLALLGVLRPRSATQELAHLVGVESLPQEPSLKAPDPGWIAGEGRTTKPARQRLLEQLVLVHVVERRGHGSTGGLAVHAHRLHLPQDSRAAMTMDHQSMSGLRGRSPAVVERAGRLQARKSLLDGGIREAFPSQPNPKLMRRQLAAAEE